MADDLEQLLSSVEGDGPSPEFVARLRGRIVEEAGPSIGSSFDVPIIDIEFAPRPQEVSDAKRWIAAVAAMVALVVASTALVVSNEDRDVERVGTADVDSGPFDADATLVTSETDLAAGGYRVDTIGTPFSFSIDEPKLVVTNDRGLFVVVHQANQGVGDRELVMTRLSKLVDPVQPPASMEGSAGWPADDFEGWLDEAGDQFMISDRRATTVGNRSAIRIDLELGETGCFVGGPPCIELGSNGLTGAATLFQGGKYRVWVIDQGDEDPVIIVASVSRSIDVAWFETVDALVSTLAFGDVVPNLIVSATADEIELPMFGSVRFELGDGSFFYRDPLSFDRVILEDWTAHSAFVANPLDAEGEMLQTSGELVAALRSSEAVTLTARQSVMVDGVEAEVFDISASTPGSVLLTSISSDVWRAPEAGRIWVIEHPDRGLLMITAEAFENQGLVLPLVLAQAEDIIESLRFIDGS